MNDDEIEKLLSDLPTPALPESWRDSILASARREAAPSPRARETWPAVLVYLRHLFARNPITVSALATLWLLILVFKAATPGDPEADRLMAQVDLHQPILIVPLAEEIRLAESWQNEPDHPPLP
jgi:hypothetical protein